MAPANNSPQFRPQPYRTNSSPKVAATGVASRSNLAVRRTTSNQGVPRTGLGLSRLESKGGHGVDGTEAGHRIDPELLGETTVTTLERRSARGSKDTRRNLEDNNKDVNGQYASADQETESDQEDPPSRHRSHDNLDHTIHAPQPRRLNMSTSTERMYITPSGSPSPSGERYSSALPDSSHPSPSSTPTPGGYTGGGGHESSHSAASKRREANRLAAARFRTRKKDQVTELEGKVAVLEADNANLKAENDVWRSGRDGGEWAQMRSSLTAEGRGGRGKGRLGSQHQIPPPPHEDRLADVKPIRHNSDEILQRVTTPGLNDLDPSNTSASGKKRRKTDLSPDEDLLDPNTPNPNAAVLSSSTGSGSGTGSSGGFGAIEEENRRLVEQMRRYETVMEGMRGEMREYRERLGMVNKGKVSKAPEDELEEPRPHIDRASSSYDPELVGSGSQSGYASSGSGRPGITLPPLTNAGRQAMSREGSQMSLNLPPLSPGLRFASPVHPSAHHNPYLSGSGYSAAHSPGGLGFSMATLAEAAVATAGNSFRLQQHTSRPASPLASLSSSPSNPGPLSKLAALAAATGRRASLDRSRSWTAYSGRASPSGDAVGVGGMNRLTLLAGGRDSPVSAERGTAMEDDEEDSGGRPANTQDEPMEYFSRQMDSGSRNTWHHGQQEDVRMREHTRSPEDRQRHLDDDDLPM